MLSRALSGVATPGVTSPTWVVGKHLYGRDRSGADLISASASSGAAYKLTEPPATAAESMRTSVSPPAGRPPSRELQRVPLTIPRQPTTDQTELVFRRDPDGSQRYERVPSRGGHGGGTATGTEHPHHEWNGSSPPPTPGSGQRPQHIYGGLGSGDVSGGGGARRETLPGQPLSPSRRSTPHRQWREDLQMQMSGVAPASPVATRRFHGGSLKAPPAAPQALDHRLFAARRDPAGRGANVPPHASLHPHATFHSPLNEAGSP